jgi:hypothetical protein
VAHNQKIGPVDATNLPINALGIYNDPAFGKTTAHFATQLNLATLAPTIGANAVVDSVYLSVPYFSTIKTTNTDGSRVYELDSIYGGQAPIKLSVFESNYFMRDLDPSTGFTESQSFYTDQTPIFENAKVGSRLNNATSTAQNDAFFFDSKEDALAFATLWAKVKEGDKAGSDKFRTAKLDRPRRISPKNLATSEVAYKVSKR